MTTPSALRLRLAIARLDEPGWRSNPPKLDLAHYGLDAFVAGLPVDLFHGTTAAFETFDLAQSRRDLVDAYYGDGIFLTPSRRVAARYARANRNTGLPTSLIDDLRARNPAAAEMLQALYDHGTEDAWEVYMGAHNIGRLADLELHLGVDPNRLMDVSHYIVGAKTPPVSESSLHDLFGGGSTGAPHWLYDELEEIGLDAATYRPKVYTVRAYCRRPLVTASRAAARRARERGFDAVVFYGADLVDGVPEVAVFDPARAVVTGVEVLD
jgi:hypothetical protein